MELRTVRPNLSQIGDRLPAKRKKPCSATHSSSCPNRTGIANLTT